MKRTINQMVKAIEANVCIRKLWRCRAGWGMMFVLTDEQFEDNLPPTLRNRPQDYEANGSVFAYYNSIQECVEAEYAVWVCGKNRPLRRMPRKVKRTR